MQRNINIARAAALLAFAITVAPNAVAGQPKADPEPPPVARVQHVPLHEVVSGTIKLTFRVTHPQLVASVVVYYRRSPAGGGSVQVHERIARRAGKGYVVTIPAAAVEPPALEYWVVAIDHDGNARPVFASSGQPQRIEVSPEPALQRARDALAQRGDTRSSVYAGAEWVDFGDRPLTAGGRKTHDRYYRAEVGYAYHFLSMVDEIRLGVVHVRGQASQVSATADGGETVSALDPGIDFAKTTVGLHPIRGLRLRATMFLGASQEGFESGFGGAIVLGEPESHYLMAGFEGISTLGLTATMAMGFMASPSVPMTATIEVSEFPVGDGHGVRLLYDAGYRFAPATEIILRVGYQGRSSITGGPTAGLRMRYAF